MSQLDTLLRQSPLLLMASRSFSPQLDISAASTFSSHTSMNGEFLKVLKSFINLVYEPILLRYGSEEDSQAVQAVTVDVLLKNGKLLRQVWKQIDQSRSGSHPGLVTGLSIVVIKADVILEMSKGLQAIYYSHHWAVAKK